MIDNLMGNQTKAVGIEFQPIAPVSLREMVLSALREAILRGTLQPGQRLTETLISKQMQVAQNVVREALQELEFQGFVMRVPNGYVRDGLLARGHQSNLPFQDGTGR